MKPPIARERTHCYRVAEYVAEIRHRQEDGTFDIERRTLCAVHAKEELPQDVSPISEWTVGGAYRTVCDA